MDLLENLFAGGTDLNVLQMTLRAAAVFLLALAMLRAAGRRSLGQHSSFDVCTAVLLGSVLSRAVVGASPFWPTMAAGLCIVLLHRAVALASLRWEWFERLVSGNKRDLIRNGQRNDRQMALGLITQPDLGRGNPKEDGRRDRPRRTGRAGAGWNHLDQDFLACS